MKAIAKITWTDGQCRITIPKILVEEVQLKGIQFVALEQSNKHQIIMRRVIDDKTFKTNGQGC